MGATKIVNVLKGDSLEELLDIVQSTPSEEVIFILPKKSKAFNSEDHFAQLSSITEKEKKKVSFMMPDTAVAAIARDAGFEVLAGGGRTASTPRKVAVAKAEPVATTVAKSLVVPDDEEQFDGGVYASEDDATVGTSDEEPMESDEDDEEDIEKAGLHIDEGEDEDDFLSKDDEEDDLEYKEEFENDLDEEEDKFEDEELEDNLDEEADEIASTIEEPVASFARAGRNLEGFARIPAKPERIKIPKIGGRELKVGIRNPRVSESGMEEIEEVWKNEAAEQKESLWKSLRPGKPSWWSRLMAPKSVAEQPVSTSRWHQDGSLKTTRKWLLFGGSAIVVVILLLFFFVPGNVRVIIKPASSPLNTQFKTSISNEFTSVDSTFNKLPGQLFELQETVTKEFIATGEKQVAQKSKGTIVVSNAYGSAPQTLIATTRFESAAGLMFRTLRTVTVPGTTVKNGEIIPGTVSVEIIADKAGAEYNIDPTTFKIPAFKERGDMERYGKFTAVSSAPIVGGAVGLAKVVTDTDFVQAKRDATNELERRLRDILAKESSGLSTVSSASLSIDSLESTAQPDQAAEKFTITTKGSLKTMGFRDSDLETLVTEYAKKNYDVVVIPEQVKVDLNDPVYNDSRGVLEVTVSIAGPGYMQIDSKDIAKNLGGKPEPDIRTYLQKVSGVDSAKVILSPFWIRKVPNNPDRIRVELEYKAN